MKIRLIKVKRIYFIMKPYSQIKLPNVGLGIYWRK